MDEIGEENTIEFVKGSHLWNKWFIPRKFANSKNYTPKDVSSEGHENNLRTYEDVPDVDNLIGVEKLKWSCRVKQN